jgi:hypothetical protein
MDGRRVAVALSISALCACSGDDARGGGGAGGGATAQTTSTGGATTSSATTVGASSSSTTSSTGGGAGGATSTTTGSGGEGGEGGAGGGGDGGTAPSGEPECLVDSDCKLIDNCCICEGVPDGTEEPPCDMEPCLLNTCDSLGLPAGSEPACVAGRCVAGFPCDWSETSCDAIPPDCPPGETAQVRDTCYGPCVPAGECLSVGGCEQCDGGLDCARKESSTVSDHCVSRPGVCDEADCACMGPSVCTEDDEECSVQDGALVCSCTTC